MYSAQIITWKVFETYEIHKSGTLPPSCDRDKHLPDFAWISHGRKLEHDICCWIGAKRSWRRWWNWVALCNPWPRSPRFLSKFLFLEVSFFVSPLLPGVFFFFWGGEVLFGESFLRLAVEKGDASSDFGSLVFVGFQATSENLAKISRTLEVRCWERWLFLGGTGPASVNGMGCSLVWSKAWWFCMDFI